MTATALSPGEAERQRAGELAAGEIVAGMKVGLGTGRSAEHFVRALAARVKAGLAIVGVPTSERTRALAAGLGIPLATLADTPELDVVVDGADEIDPALRLIKGGGGALLREKIVASAARRMIVVAEGAKLVPVLGAFPLPVEVIPFGMNVTLAAIRRLAVAQGLVGTIALRESHGRPFVTDSGNHILDASFGRIPDADSLADGLNRIPGVVEHGLFIGFPVTAIVAHGDCVEWLTPPASSRMERNDNVQVP